MFKSHTQIMYQPAFGFYANFPTSILISVSWYSPGVLPWMEFYTIRTRYGLRHPFKHWLSIQKEYVIDISCTNYFKNRWNYTGVPKDGNRRVGFPTSWFAHKLFRLHSPTWSDESSLLFVVHLLHLILFVEEYACGGPSGVRRLLTNLQSGSSHVF